MAFDPFVVSPKSLVTLFWRKEKKLIIPNASRAHVMCTSSSCDNPHIMTFRFGVARALECTAATNGVLIIITIGTRWYITDGALHHWFAKIKYRTSQSPGHKGRFRVAKLFVARTFQRKRSRRARTRMKKSEKEIFFSFRLEGPDHVYSVREICARRIVFFREYTRTNVYKLAKENKTRMVNILESINA